MTGAAATTARQRDGSHAGEPAVLVARDVRRGYTIGVREVEVLRGINLEVRRGELVAITGPSGAGKSTLLHLLGLLDVPDGGEILVDGSPASDLTDAERSRLRAVRIGFVFQTFHLLPGYDAVGNVALAGTLAGLRRRRARARALELLEAVGLGARADHLASELSGGERQRVGVARALMNDPAIVLADEPTGNLDSASGREVLDLLTRVRDEQGRTVVVVTHDPTVAERTDRVVRLLDGRLDGGPAVAAG